ncbi:hypothetical protein EMCRGX_G031959 [Ephydatia muelleri]|eukprot:Em0018g43a
MYPLGSEMIWKVIPVGDGHTKDVFANFVPLKSSWGNCSSTKVSTVLSITSDPDPLVRGSSFTIYAKVRLAQELSGGKLYATIRYMGVKIGASEYSLCDAASMAGLSCPVASGLQEVMITSSISSSAPTGTYTIKITATDQYDQDAACVKVYINVISQ